jgi:hypothetical protein
LFLIMSTILLATLLYFIVRSIFFTIEAFRNYFSLTNALKKGGNKQLEGYVAVSGTVQLRPGQSPHAVRHDTPCLWYRLLVEERRMKAKGRSTYWATHREEISTEPFWLIDDTGASYLIDPKGIRAEISPTPIAADSECRSTMWQINPGTHVHVWGQLIALKPTSSSRTLPEDARSKLTAWHSSGEALRFDLDGNGRLSPDELILARAAAQREVKREQAAANLTPEYRLSAPTGNIPFLLTETSPDKTIRLRCLDMILCLATTLILVLIGFASVKYLYSETELNAFFHQLPVW